MALYDPVEPKHSTDLLTEAILISHRTIFCHFFMECGKKATKQSEFHGKKINVCDLHFNEINLSKN